MLNDTRSRAITPEGVIYELSTAGLVVRGCAYLIDSIIQTGLSFTLIILLNLFSSQWLFALILFLITWFYHVLFDFLLNGQSPGKRVFSLRVVMSDGSPVSLGASFLRNLLRFADNFLSLNVIGVGVMLGSRGFKRLGDWSADTLVVYDAKRRYINKRLKGTWSTNSSNMVLPIGVNYEEKQTILKFCRRYPLLGPERGDEICSGFVDCISRNEEDKKNPAQYLLSLGTSIIGAASS
ncbi:hypothetical protein ES705_12083 [subsurface metagenome]